MSGCPRCDNGWMTHPDGWAVACPNCAPDPEAYWLPGDDGQPGRVVRRYQLPAGHPSQRVVPTPDWYVGLRDEYRAKVRARRDAHAEEAIRRATRPTTETETTTTQEDRDEPAA